MRIKKPRLTSIVAHSLSPRAGGGFDPRPASRSPLEVALRAFRTDCDDAIQDLRRALLSLARESDSDPLKPQEVSRRFALNKNLTWKFARVLLAPDSFAAIPMLPGPEGLEIYLRAFEGAGIDHRHTDPVRAAIRKFDATVAHHFGDRAQLEVVLDGLRSDGNLEASRRTAFKGMAGVFGMRARSRITAQILSPNSDNPNNADVTLIAGLVGLQRIRPIGSLPVFRAGFVTPSDPSQPQPVFASADQQHPDFLLRDFSSFPNAVVRSFESGGRHCIELSEGPLGRIGESDLFFASTIRGRMNVRKMPNDTATEFMTLISLPAENFSSDLFVHKSFEGLATLQSSIHSTLAQPLSQDETQRANTMLPIDCAPTFIEKLSEGFALSTYPRYETIVHQAFAAIGAKIADYRLIRVTMAYPPAPSVLLVRWDLPD